eukprot:5328300-Amphidinium_carterae.1
MGQLSTSDLDAHLLRWLISDCAFMKSKGKGSKYGIAGMDISTAFLHAPLPDDRLVILMPPKVLFDLKILKPDILWIVRKAMYGLRESPGLWS